MYHQRILLVDDDPGMIEMLKKVLQKEGYSFISSAFTGEEALTQVKQQSFDYIVLDVMLPDIDGFNLCQSIRQITHSPILFLTARSSDLDKLTGFGVGGDDYVTKPFNPLEIVARIKAHFRRTRVNQSSVTSDGAIQHGRLVIDKQAGQLFLDGQEIYCPAKELAILHFLASHPNQVFTAGQLYEKIWGYDYYGDAKTVAVHIMRLRKKIERDPKHPELIVTLRNIGYKFVSPQRGKFI